LEAGGEVGVCAGTAQKHICLIHSDLTGHHSGERTRAQYATWTAEPVTHARVVSRNVAFFRRCLSILFFFQSSLAGFILFYLGRLPRATDHFEWNGLRFEIMDMDGNRIDKVLVMRAA